MRLLISGFCALAFCLLSTEAWGDSLTIQNASFETTSPLSIPCTGACAYNFGPIPGWSITGSTGSFEPSSSFFSLPLPDGSIVAFTNGGSISQTLTGISLLPNSIYTLSVDVGRRFDVVTANYSLSLTDGSNVFCTSNGSNGSVPAGTFVDVTLTCATGASAPAGFLGIELTGDGRQIDFDNVQLSVESAVSTPEPSALALTFVGLFVSGLLFVRSRRNQYLQSASS
jgi:HpiC1 cyclase